MAKFVNSVLLLLFASAAFAQNEPAPAKAPDAAAAPTVAPRPRRRPASAFLVTGQPYSAELTNDHFQTLIDGTHLTRRYSTTKLFRDSQGRIRIEKTMDPGLRGLDTTEIYDPRPEFSIISTSLGEQRGKSPFWAPLARLHQPLDVQPTFQISSCLTCISKQRAKRLARR